MLKVVEEHLANDKAKIDERKEKESMTNVVLFVARTYHLIDSIFYALVLIFGVGVIIEKIIWLTASEKRKESAEMRWRIEYYITIFLFASKLFCLIVECVFALPVSIMNTFLQVILWGLYVLFWRRMYLWYKFSK